MFSTIFSIFLLSTSRKTIESIQIFVKEVVFEDSKVTEAEDGDLVEIVLVVEKHEDNYA